MKLSLLLWLTCAQFAGAATYYVDFDGGSDSNAGTSTGTAWKHCPGDDNATGSANITLSAGDTVNFKGGVAYRGSVVSIPSGSLGNRIEFIGSGHGWGTGRAIMDGSEIITTQWTNCVNQADADGNTNWANIWYTVNPSWNTNFALPQLLRDGTNQCLTAQDPNPTNDFLIDGLSTFYSLASGTYGDGWIKDTSRIITDSYTNAYVMIYSSGNETRIRKVASYQSSTNALLTASYTPLGSGTSYYSMLNWMPGLDRQWEYVVSTNRGRIFVWADNTNHVFSLARLGYGFYDIGGCAYVTIAGFEFRGYFGMYGLSTERGLAARLDGGGTHNAGIIYRDNDAYFMRDLSRQWCFLIKYGIDPQVTSNTVRQSVYGGGVSVSLSGGSPLIRSNYFKEIGQTPIYAPSTTNVMIELNVITNTGGTHANGISVYPASVSATVRSNKLWRTGANPFTFENITNVTVEYNLVDMGGGVSYIMEWAASTGGGDWIFRRNTFVNSGHGNYGLLLGYTGGPADKRYHIYHNIIDRGGVFSSTSSNYAFNNIYTRLATWSGNQNTNEYGSGEILYTNTAALFTDWQNGDWTLKAGSPAIGFGSNGTDVGYVDFVNTSAIVPAVVAPGIPNSKADF